MEERPVLSPSKRRDVSHPPFAKPLTPVQSGVSASDSEGISSVKNEKDKEKPKRKATPSPSPVKGGAVGGKVKGDSCADGNSGGGLPSLGVTMDSVAKLKAHIGGKGECDFVVIVLHCNLGRERCQLCRGHCCTLVNSVINALVEQGDLDPNAEV